MGIDKKDAIYVGDSEVDVKTFVSAGLDGIGVLWGFRPKELLVDAGCVHFASDGQELLDKILSF